jgi:LPS-assembly lipoprotein
LGLLLTAGLSAGLVGCGFRLRGSQTFAFESISITPEPGGAVAQQLRHSFGPTVQVLAMEGNSSRAQLLLEVSNELREKVVVGVSTAGQVREFQLRLRVRLRLRTGKGKGKTLIEDAEILQRRDISYNETAALAKEAEEALLYRDMQTDIVQQILRRLVTVQASQLD